MKQSVSICQSSKNETIQEQKEVALLLLSKLSFVDPNAMLAGGAVRDWRHGMVASDLDFYLKAPNHKQSDIEHLLQKLGCISIKKLEKNTDKVYKELPYISSVWEAYYGDTRLNFIFLESDLKVNIIHYFSNALCECFMKDGGFVEYSKDFEEAILTKKVKTRYGLNHPHIIKMAGKFPDYHFFRSYRNVYDD